MEIEMAALLDFSAADFLGFFASRFDFLRPLAMAASRVGEVGSSLRRCRSPFKRRLSRVDIKIHRGGRNLWCEIAARL